MLAVGLATLGYTGSRRGMRWPLLAGGIGLAFLVRPHVAAVLGMSVVAAEWLRSWQKISGRHVLEAVGITMLAVVLFLGMSFQFGEVRPELDSLTDLMVWQRMQTAQGGSNIGSVPLRGLRRCRYRRKGGTLEVRLLAGGSHGPPLRVPPADRRPEVARSPAPWDLAPQPR